MPVMPVLHTSVGLRLGFACALIVSLLGLWLSEGNWGVGLAPLAAGLVGVALLRAPLRYWMHLVLAIGLLVDNPIERPGQNRYKSWLLPLGTLLYETLNKSLHLSGFKLTGMQLLMLVLMGVASLRILSSDRVDGKMRWRAAAPFLRACLVAMGTLLAWEFYGLARGGSPPHSIFQMQTMFFMPMMAMVFAYAFKSTADLRLMLTTFMTVGVLRALLCIYYYLTVFRAAVKDGGESGDGSYVTTHSDSILAAVTIVICIATVYQSPSFKALLRAALIVPVVAIGIFLNNRRIAFVSVGLGLAFSYAAAMPGFRRRVQRTVLTAVPFALVYLAAGWGAHGGWAKPVQTVKSVLLQKDTSSATRDIENFNLLQTLKVNPIFGSGFGHKYVEAVQAFDISKIFEAYRYVPHNNFLWLWGACGMVGFSLYWMHLSVGLFMATRVCLSATSHAQALTAMTAITAVVAYSVQAFGDMGMFSWVGSLMVASTLGACASAATANGAWVNRSRKRVGARATPAAENPQVAA